MSYTPPPLSPEAQRDADRTQALRIGTPDALRAWAEQYDAPLFHLDDDELLLLSIHEARVVLFQGAARRQSRAWLDANKARILAERETP